MFKKVAITVAVVIASMLALSPLALADTVPGDGINSPNIIGDPEAGLVNLGGVNVLNGNNVCPGVVAPIGLGNVLGILGLGGTDPTGTGGPIDCQADNSSKLLDSDN